MDFKKTLISVLTAACIGMPAYAFNWTVDIDREVKSNSAKIEASEKAAERERELAKERFELQQEQLRNIEKLLLRGL